MPISDAEKSALLADAQAYSDDVTALDTTMPLTDTQLSQLKAAAQKIIDDTNVLVADQSPEQTIDSFTASASSIVNGESVTLTWATSNATAVRLNGAVVAASGSQSFAPSADTTYMLEADGSAPTVSQSLAIAVNAASGPLDTLAPGHVRLLGDWSDGTAGMIGHHEYGSIAYDPTGRRMLMFGGGHSAGCYNDDVIALSCDTFTVPFRSLYQPTPNTIANVTNRSDPYYCDLDRGFWLWDDVGVPVTMRKRCASHTWGGMTVWQNRLYLLSTGGGATAHGASYFDLSSNQWTWLRDLSPALLPSPCTGTDCPWYYVITICGDPVSGKILIAGSYGSTRAARFWVYDPQANTLSAPINPGFPAQWASGPTWAPDVIYDPAQDVFVFITPSVWAGSGAKLPATVGTLAFNRGDYAASTYRAIATTGIIPPYMPGGGQTPPSRWKFHPASGTIIGAVIYGKYYQVAVDAPAGTGVWTEHQLLNEDGTNASLTQDYLMLEYDPISGCFVVLTQGTNNYKAHAFRP